MVIAQQFGAMLREKPYADLPGPVRAALRAPIETAIGAGKLDDARTAMGGFAAAAAANVPVCAALDDVRDKIEALEGTDLDATAAKTALQKLTEAQTAANAMSGDARIAALAKVTSAAAKPLQDAEKLLTGKANTGAANGLAALRKGVDEAIKALAAGDPRKALETRLAEWDKAKDTADKEADPDKKKAALDTLGTDADKLLDDALAASGGSSSKKRAAAAKKQEIYKEALEKRFGIEILNTDGTKNTHFDQFYEMMATVPVQQSVQSSLNLLTYDKKSGGAAYGKGTMGTKQVGFIEMGGSINEADVGWEYHGKKVEVFKINTLHEIGHSVDDKYGIMAKNMGGKGCGGWEKTSIDAVASAFVDQFRKGDGKDIKVPNADLVKAVKAALQKQPIKDEFGNSRVTGADTKDQADAGIKDADWPKIKALLDSCIQTRSDNWPWGKSKTVTLDKRAWHEAYAGEWYSYDPGARAAIEEVRDYQWRSPAEWFAELYAYTWYKKQEPKGGVAKEAAKYMYRPGGGEMAA